MCRLGVVGEVREDLGLDFWGFWSVWREDVMRFNGWGRVMVYASLSVVPKDLTPLTWYMLMIVAVMHSTPVMPSVAESWNIVAVVRSHR